MEYFMGVLVNHWSMCYRCASWSITLCINITYCSLCLSYLYYSQTSQITILYLTQLLDHIIWSICRSIVLLTVHCASTIQSSIVVVYPSCVYWAVFDPFEHLICLIYSLSVALFASSTSIYSFDCSTSNQYYTYSSSYFTIHSGCTKETSLCLVVLRVSITCVSFVDHHL